MHGELEAIAASIRTSFVIMLLQHSTIELCDNATKNQERPSRSESGVSVLVSNTQNKTGRRNERGSSDKSSWDEVRNSTGIIGALGTLVRMVSSQTAVCLFFSLVHHSGRPFFVWSPSSTEKEPGNTHTHTLISRSKTPKTGYYQNAWRDDTK